jgi:hypothetical protein
MLSSELNYERNVRLRQTGVSSELTILAGHSIYGKGAVGKRPVRCCGEGRSLEVDLNKTRKLLDEKETEAECERAYMLKRIKELDEREDLPCAVFMNKILVMTAVVNQ